MTLAPFLESCRNALRTGDAAREQALVSALARGLPSKRDEDWKYSEPSLLAQKQFQAASSNNGDAAPWLLDGLDATSLIFVNGHYRADLSGPFPPGLRLEKAGDAVAATASSSFSDLNFALAEGWQLALDEGAAPQRPVHLLYLHSAAGSMSHHRMRLRLGRGSALSLIEHYAGAEHEYFCNAHTSAVLADGARLRHYRLQQHGPSALHVGQFQIQQAGDSQFYSHSVDLGGLWVRNDLQASLAAPGAQAHLHGVYAPGKRQHMDNHTRVDHRAPRGTSREVFKGILDGHGRGVFNGKIVVHQDAQKTDSEQSSAALLLSRTAEVDAKPELEIYADDVKCKHGATVGQLDEDAVFYLRSRGLSEPAARGLLTYSFVDALIGQIEIQPLRRHIEAALLSRLPGAEQFAGLLQ
ncbi:MAG: Fe-S cluster assembly protein SufD [Nevskiales bacterium]